jgi:glycosyltransferase involved in cell wall biosynthesis
LNSVLPPETKHLSILFLGTQMAVGGAQKLLLEQAHWFHERGHKVIVVFFYDKENFHKKWQDVSAFHIVNLNAFQKGAGIFVNAVSLLKGLWKFWKLLRKEQVSVIETFTHDSNILALPLAWMARIPVRIATHHGVIDGFPRWREKIHAWIINNNIARTIVVVSEMTRQRALEEGIKAERIIVIQNGITPISLEGVDRSEVRKEAGMQDDDLVILSVGRLVYQKGHEYLVAAMPTVLREFPNAKVGICGDGLLRADLESQVQLLGLSDSVKLLGKSDGVAKFLASADVFVLPSRSREGLSIALLEAMSAELPIVATKVEGMDEVISEGENGLLVPIKNPDVLAQAILQLLRDPQMRKRMGAASKQRLHDLYTIDRMCERYLALMFDLMCKI